MNWQPGPAVYVPGSLIPTRADLCTGPVHYPGRATADFHMARKRLTPSAWSLPLLILGLLVLLALLCHRLTLHFCKFHKIASVDESRIESSSLGITGWAFVIGAPLTSILTLTMIVRAIVSHLEIVSPQTHIRTRLRRFVGLDFARRFTTPLGCGQCQADPARKGRGGRGGGAPRSSTRPKLVSKQRIYYLSQTWCEGPFFSMSMDHGDFLSLINLAN